MKYVLVLLDGMADYSIAELDGKTPVEYARTPAMDGIAKHAEIGRVRTVRGGFKPGSDVANLGVLGYDVTKCYTGRSPLEALSIGIDMLKDDLALRANLVTLSDDKDFGNKIMLDYSAGEISTEEAAKLISDLYAFLKEEGLTDGMELHVGTSYRHCMILHNSEPKETLTPPHDITGRRIGEYLPEGGQSDKLLKIIKASYEYLSKHPINVTRAAIGKNPANSLWLWGEGTKPAIENFKEKYGKSAVMISAVDLLKGIAVGGGMKVAEVEGATGRIDTNFDGKAARALSELKDGADFCMIHLEATDECGHQGNAKEKARAIELIDEKIIAPIFDYLKNSGEAFNMLIMPDHYTPVSTRTHSSEPVPYMLYTSGRDLGSNPQYSETVAEQSGIMYENPWELTEKLFEI